jgi:hypothetical protein
MHAFTTSAKGMAAVDLLVFPYSGQPRNWILENKRPLKLVKQCCIRSVHTVYSLLHGGDLLMKKT